METGHNTNKKGERSEKIEMIFLSSFKQIESHPPTARFSKGNYHLQRRKRVSVMHDSNLTIFCNVRDYDICRCKGISEVSD